MILVDSFGISDKKNNNHGFQMYREIRTKKTNSCRHALPFRNLPPP